MDTTWVIRVARGAHDQGWVRPGRRVGLEIQAGVARCVLEWQLPH